MHGDEELLSALDRLAPHITALALKHQQPPGALYVSNNDSLFIAARAAIAGLTVTFVSRVRRTDGLVREMVEVLRPASDRTDSTVALQLGEGWLLGLVVSVSGATVRRGQCYVSARLRGSGAASPIESRLVWKGYALSAQPTGFPVAPAHEPLDGRGAFRSITGTDPAAGAEISETVPTGAHWRLLALRATLVTSAVVGNRVPRILLDDGASVYYVATPTQAIVASTTVGLDAIGASWRPDTFAGVTETHVPLDPRIILPPAHRIRTSTAALDAGDNYSAPQYLVEEWLAN